MTHTHSVAKQSLVALLVSLALSASAVVGAQEAASTDPQIVRWAENPTSEMQWGEWDHVVIEKRKGADAGADNSHPSTLSEAAVATALRKLKLRYRGDPAPVFGEEDVARLAPAIALGLAQAKPDQDLLFFLSSRHDTAIYFAAKVTNSGRAFVRDGKLNLIFGQIASDAVLNLRGGAKPKKDYGSRSQARAQHELLANTAQARPRPDWVVLDLSTQATAPAAANATPGAAAERSADTAIEAHYRKQQTRLRELQRMLELGLITEAEFKAKRAEVLKEL